MLSRASLRQQLYPLLTLLPLALLGSAVLFDYSTQTSGVRLFGEVALWDMAAGIIGGMACLCVHLVDLLVAPPRSEIRRVVGRVVAATGSMIVLFAFIWSLRVDSDPAGSSGLFVLEFFALASGVVGAWLARGLAVAPGAASPSPDDSAGLSIGTAEPAYLDEYFDAESYFDAGLNLADEPTVAVLTLDQIWPGGLGSPAGVGSPIWAAGSPVPVGRE